MENKISKAITNFVFKYRIKKAVKEANRLHAETRYNYLVINMNNKPICVQRKKVKELLAAKFFKKHITMEMLERSAYYKTY